MKKIIILIILLLLVTPSIVSAYNAFPVKWDTDLSQDSRLSQIRTDDCNGNEWMYASNVAPVADDLDGDGFDEIFFAVGFDACSTLLNEGYIVCIDSKDGSIIWFDWKDGYGSHTCMELYDVDGDGIVELLATGYHDVTMYEAESGIQKWTYERPNNRLDKPALILPVGDEVYVYITSNRMFTGDVSLQKINANTGQIVTELTDGPIHPCHGGLTAADLDKDGNTDIVCTDRNYGGNHKGLHCYNTDLTLKWEHPDVQCSSHVAQILDVDGDGWLDVVAGHQSTGSGGICVIDGETGEKMKWTSNLGLWTHYTPAVYDIDNDGDLEFITTRSTTDMTYVFDISNWEMENTEMKRPDGYGLAKPPVIANVVGDSDREIIFMTHNGFDIFNGQYENIHHQSVRPSRADRILVKDIDSDGLNEIVAISLSTTDWMMYTRLICYETEGESTDEDIGRSFLYTPQRTLAPQENTENWYYDIGTEPEPDITCWQCLDGATASTTFPYDTTCGKDEAINFPWPYEPSISECSESPPETCWECVNGVPINSFHPSGTDCETIGLLPNRPDCNNAPTVPGFELLFLVVVISLFILKKKCEKDK